MSTVDNTTEEIEIHEPPKIVIAELGYILMQKLDVFREALAMNMIFLALGSNRNSDIITMIAWQLCSLQMHEHFSIYEYVQLRLSWSFPRRCCVCCQSVCYFCGYEFIRFQDGTVETCHMDSECQDNSGIFYDLVQPYPFPLPLDGYPVERIIRVYHYLMRRRIHSFLIERAQHSQSE